MDKKIIVKYWTKVLHDVPFKDGLELPYSVQERNYIIHTVLGLGYSVMVRPLKKDNGWEVEGELIWIDEGRFSQR